MSELSRRSFLKLGAGAISSVALFNLVPFTAMASDTTTNGTSRNVRIRSVSVSDLPEATKAAHRSELASASYAYILDRVNQIKDGSLRNQTINLLKHTYPTFMEMYRSPAAVHKVYTALVDAKLVDPSKLPEDKLFPPLPSTPKNPQDFITAPGSGYHGHHAYPGGLPNHTAANLSISEGIVDSYHHVFGYDVNNDIVVAAQALHDLAKPWVFQWQDDNSSLKEYPIAGTGAHHVLGVVEAIHRGLPSEEIIAQACAHNHPGSPDDEAKVVNWIKAGAMIAQVDPVKYGLLDSTGNKLPVPHHQAGYIVHLGDHDWVLSGDAAKHAVNYLQTIAKNDYHLSESDLTGPLFNKFRNYVGAQVSFMQLHHVMATQGLDGVRNLVHQIIV